MLILHTVNGLYFAHNLERLDLYSEIQNGSHQVMISMRNEVWPLMSFDDHRDAVKFISNLRSSIVALLQKHAHPDDVHVEMLSALVADIMAELIEDKAT